MAPPSTDRNAEVIAALLMALKTEEDETTLHKVIL